jgi:hypothetical protein
MLCMHKRVLYIFLYDLSCIHVLIYLRKSIVMRRHGQVTTQEETVSQDVLSWARNIL